MTSFLDRQPTSQPLHLLRDRGGLGDWRWMLHFRTTPWQVPGSMGFVGRESETKHHLWKRNLIDCCSHYPVRFLKLLRAWARKSQRGTGGKRWALKEGGRGVKRYGAQQCKTLEVLCELSSSGEDGRQTAARGKRNPKTETHTTVFSPCAIHSIRIFSLDLCMVLTLGNEEANVLSFADKRSDFSSL